MDWQLTKQNLGYWAIAPKDGPSIDPVQTTRVNASDRNAAEQKAKSEFLSNGLFKLGETLYSPDGGVIVEKSNLPNA